MRVFVFLLISVILSSCSVSKLQQLHPSQRKADFEQFDFDDLSKMYMRKIQQDENAIEGIYSVSHVIIKKSKPFLSGTEREKTVDRKENYSTVVILKEAGTAARDYFEIPIGASRQLSYSVRGEFSLANEGSILIYRHFEPKKKVLTYTFTHDADKDILEGVRTENNGNAVIVYKLTYVKLYTNGNATPSK